MKVTLTAIVCTLVLPAGAQTQSVEVVEYHPAPGQFVNELPEAEEGDTQKSICQKATQQLQDGLLVHLGAFGGYMTVKFDHPIENKPGSDLRIKGNGFYAEDDPQYGTTTIGGSIEPGIVYVGVGDDLETASWYELAGSEYYTTEIHNFQVTYHKPTAESGEHSLTASSYDNYIQWEASWTENGAQRDSSGYHQKNAYHKQTYWPLWEDAETMTFCGGRVPNNAVEQSGEGKYWVQYRYSADSYGYVDASNKDDDYETFDLDWAVNADGTPAHIDHADFIRVQTAIFQYCGWLGETSTEVASFIDLHLVDGYDDNPIFLTTSIHPTTTPTWGTHTYYNLMGQKIGQPVKGQIYIVEGRKVVFR